MIQGNHHIKKTGAVREVTCTFNYMRRHVLTVLRSRNFISGNRSADLQRTFIYFTSSYFCELTKCLNFDFEDTLFSRMKTKQTYHYKYTVVPFFRLLFSQI